MYTMDLSRPLFPVVVFAFALVLGGTHSARAQGQNQSLFTDPVAREAGDIITVVINEETSAQRSSSFEGDAETQTEAGGGGTFPGGISESFSADASFSNETEKSNESVASDMLNGTFTARVTGVDGTGNLQIRGERRLTIDGVTHIMEVTGVVRPTDIRQDNTVLSNQIANAQIKYGEEGFQNDGFFAKGLLIRAGSIIGTGLAIFFGVR